MALTSLNFFIFLFSALFVYYVFPKKISYIVLFLYSLLFLFMGSSEVYTLLYVLGLFLIGYGGGLLINKYKDDNKKKTIVLVLSIVLVVGLLIYLKCTNLFIVPYNLFAKNKIDLLYPDVPIGISYYSLMLIGYLVDVYWGVHEPSKNPIKVGLFMTFFPIVVSGPFLKYSENEDKLFNKAKFNVHNLLDGFIRVLWGAFKILVISSRIGIFVDGFYSNIANYSGLVTACVILLYTIQLYCNFSGTIDMVLGVSKMFGIELPENFDKPFVSQTITEFWRRWHITLGTWLKNYIFYPMMKSKGIQKMNNTLKTKWNGRLKKLPMYLCLLVLWLLIGIWHGGAYHFILASGLLQFIFIVIEDVFGMVNKKGDMFDTIFRVFRTFVIFSLCMVFFRASSVEQGILVFKNLFSNASYDFTATGLSLVNFGILGFALFILYVVEYFKGGYGKGLYKKSGITKLFFIYIMIVLVLLLGVYGLGFNATDFIYSKF